MDNKLVFGSVFVVCFFLSTFFYVSSINASSKANKFEVLEVGKTMPNALLQRFGHSGVEIKDLKGKVKIISIVPKLNTPVCDKQTHQFSEQNGGLDKQVDIITISTNSTEGQNTFAKKAKINNLIFLSDKAELSFGRNTGLLIEEMGMLARTVLVLDEKNTIRYVDFVPGGGLPDIKGALAAAKKVLLKES
jgi:thiol peroxidase